MLDLRQHLAHPTFEAETVLWKHILSEANVNL